MRRVLALIVGFAAFVILLPAAVAGLTSAGSGSSYQTVRNLDDFFAPNVIRVAAGTEVKWVNSGRSPHTVTADDGTFDSGVLEHGEDFEHTFTTAGVFRFTCLLHGKPGGIGMTGIVVVGDAKLPSNDGAGAVGPGREPVPVVPGRTIHVPADEPSIQAGVDAASPGDLVLVTTPYLTIRGEDRNTTILDGELTKSNGIHVAEADGVAVENMTARHYGANGFYWSSVNGYRGSYLTAYDNGDYGIYAFDSVWGRFEHSYAGSSPDSAFYIGQCQPCHAVIDDVVGANSALGYSGTNAGGDLWIINSEWVGNGSGIAPNTLDSELLAPQRGAVVAGNWVHDSGVAGVPTKALIAPTSGFGIVVLGGRDNVLAGNVVDGSRLYGIGVMPDLDTNLWATRGNEVRDNDVTNSGRADLVLGAPSVRGDCFAGNGHGTSLPPAIEALAGCDRRVGGGGEVGSTVAIVSSFATVIGGDYEAGTWADRPGPGDQATMPDAATMPIAMAIPETAVPGPHDVRPLSAVRPDRATTPRITREVTLMGIPLTATLTTVVGLYGYVFPLALYASWIAIALWDLIRREELSDRRRIGWMALVLVVPVVGPVAYFLGGGSTISTAVRWFLVVGGLAIYLGIAVLALLVEAM
jgi:plastocyanin/uncharacterized membrane protein YhaH (DUF805 family)